MKLKTSKLFIAAAICLSMFSSQNATATKEDASPLIYPACYAACRPDNCRRTEKGVKRWNWCNSHCTWESMKGCDRVYNEDIDSEQAASNKAYLEEYEKSQKSKGATPSAKKSAPENKGE